jgi:hypothetical protein
MPIRMFLKTIATIDAYKLTEAFVDDFIGYEGASSRNCRGICAALAGAVGKVSGLYR